MSNAPVAKKSDAQDHPALGCLGLILLMIAVQLAIWLATVTWPIWLCLAVSTAAWRLARAEKRSLLAGPAEEIFFCVSVGLALLFGVLVLLNTGALAASEQQIRNGEAALIRIRLLLEEGLRKVDLKSSIIVFAALLASTWVAPRIDFVKQFLAIKMWARRLSMVLTVVVSFTLFSQIPLRDLGTRDHEESASRYEMSIREEENAIGQYLAARAVSASLPSLQPVERQQLRMLMASIEQETKKTELDAGASAQQTTREFVIRQIAGEDAVADIASAGLKEFVVSKVGDLRNSPEQPTIKTLGKEPESRTEFNQQKAILNRQEQRRARAEALKKSAIEALKDLFNSILGLATPDVKGIGGNDIENVADRISDEVFEGVAAKWRAGALPKDRFGSLQLLAGELLPSGNFLSKMLRPANSDFARPDTIQAAIAGRVKAAMDQEHNSRLPDSNPDRPDLEPEPFRPRPPFEPRPLAEPHPAVEIP